MKTLKPSSSICRLPHIFTLRRHSGSPSTNLVAIVNHIARSLSSSHRQQLPTLVRVWFPGFLLRPSSQVLMRLRFTCPPLSSRSCWPPHVYPTWTSFISRTESPRLNHSSQGLYKVGPILKLPKADCCSSFVSQNLLEPSWPVNEARLVAQTARIYTRKSCQHLYSSLTYFHEYLLTNCPYTVRETDLQVRLRKTA